MIHDSIDYTMLCPPSLPGETLGMLLDLRLLAGCSSRSVP